MTKSMQQTLRSSIHGMKDPTECFVLKFHIISKEAQSYSIEKDKPKVHIDRR